MRVIKKAPLALCILTFLFILSTISVSAKDEVIEKKDALDSLSLQEVNMVEGELVTLAVYNLTRISVTNPEVADIVDADIDELLVIARKVGQTALFLWDDQGKRTIMINVLKQDLDIVKNRIRRLLESAAIENVKMEVNDKEGKVVVSGDVAEKKQELFNQILDPFRDNVIVLTSQEEIRDLVQIDMQITEVNETLTKNMGVDWSTPVTDSGGNVTDTQVLTFGYAESLPSGTIDNVGDIFKLGDFARTNSILTRVNALIAEGKGKILSQPKLVVVSGEEASFLVGGEIPIKSTTLVDSGASQENFEFKDYGVSMTVTPEIIGKKIDILLNVEITDIDSANQVGDTVAFLKRTAQTHLFLDNQQTIVLAGLIRSTESETLKRVPFLSKIPIAGALFRNRGTNVPNQDQELIISLTPTVLSSQGDIILAKEKEAAPQEKKDTAHRADMGQAVKILEEKEIDMDAEGELTDEMIEAMIEELESETMLEGERLAQKGSLGQKNFKVEDVDALHQYIRGIQEDISNAITYPAEAEGMGWEGTVKVGLLILNDGTLALSTIRESSGNEIFDNSAINTVNRLAPFKAFPPTVDQQEIAITVPIVYNFNND